MRVGTCAPSTGSTSRSTLPGLAPLWSNHVSTDLARSVAGQHLLVVGGIEPRLQASYAMYWATDCELQFFGDKRRRDSRAIFFIAWLWLWNLELCVLPLLYLYHKKTGKVPALLKVKLQSISLHVLLHPAITLEQDPTFLKLVHLRQRQTPNHWGTIHLFPVQNHGLMHKGIYSHLGHLALSNRPIQNWRSWPEEAIRTTSSLMTETNLLK